MYFELVRLCDANFCQKLTNIVSLIALKLYHFTIFGMLHHSTITGEFLAKGKSEKWAQMMQQMKSIPFCKLSQSFSCRNFPRFPVRLWEFFGRFVVEFEYGSSRPGYHLHHHETHLRMDLEENQMLKSFASVFSLLTNSIEVLNVCRHAVDFIGSGCWIQQKNEEKSLSGVGFQEI